MHLFNSDGRELNYYFKINNAINVHFKTKKFMTESSISNIITLKSINRQKFTLNSKKFTNESWHFLHLFIIQPSDTWLRCISCTKRKEFCQGPPMPSYYINFLTWLLATRRSRAPHASSPWRRKRSAAWTCGWTWARSLVSLFIMSCSVQPTGLPSTVG